MKASTSNVATMPFTYAHPSKTTTTLYDLVEALLDETGPDEDELVTLAVVDLFHSGRAKWVNPPQEHEFAWFTETTSTELTA